MTSVSGGLGSTGGTVGLDDLKALSNVIDSMVL